MCFKLGIFNAFNKGRDSYELYIDACKELGVPYEVIDIVGANWIENVRASDCDAFLVRPTPYYVAWKRMYDERLYHVVHSLGRIIYPSHHELLLYENKRHMAYFLQAHNLPAPKTMVFYDLEEALTFTEKAALPLVFKTHIGAQASGVKILRTRAQARQLIRQVFRYGYIRKLRTNVRGLFQHKVSVPYYFFEPEYKVAILQEYLPDALEWRMIRIGESYFGHQKLKKGDFHSGSMLVGWERPPDRLLDFVRYVCDVGQFNSMCLDIFEDRNGKYYVNELQSVFGSYNPSQMYIDGKPGRFLYDRETSGWRFEEGYFSRNGSCNLRVEHLLKLLGSARSEVPSEVSPVGISGS